MFTLKRNLTNTKALFQAYSLLTRELLNLNPANQSSTQLLILLNRGASFQANAHHPLSHSTTGTPTKPGVSSPGPKGRTLPPYMVFRAANHGQPSVAQLNQRHSTLAFDLNSTQAELEASTQEVALATRPLVLLFAWMLSKNSHIEKYREFWIARGYDILTVQTSPIDLLLPSIGGKRVAQNVYSFLSKISPRYEQVLVHAFSVGGYQLGELLERLYIGLAQGEPEAERLFKSIKGFLIDSVVFAEDAAPGLSRAITLNPVVQPVLEKSIATFLKATKPFTFDRYKVVEAHIIDNKRRIPAKLLFSKDDVVSNYRSNHAVVASWAKKGITTDEKCWERSAHVLHYREHPQEYEAEIDSFVSRLDIKVNRN